MKHRILTVILVITISRIFGQYIIREPQLMGGSYNFKMIFDNEFYYPPQAISDMREGEVVVSFTINAQGTPDDFKVIQSVHPQLDSVFIEILKLYTWIPGIRDGVNYPMVMKQSHHFKIKKYQKLVERRGYDAPPFAFQPYSKSLKVYEFKSLQLTPKSIYKGKQVNINQFISEYIKVPDAALKQGISGVVEIAFIVESSGRISNFREIKGIGGGCTEEAYRLIQMVDWEPGMLKNEYVRSEYQIKVNFGKSQY